jgi:aromatic ring-opening dioxygenase catalytic subunit (LigB family)
MSDPRLPTYFISHGGGPWPWIKDLLPGDFGLLEASLRQIPREIEVRPRAVLMISGHWEASVFTVQTSASPPMLYDYGGFPEFTYHLEYPAPGSPEVAERVLELLAAAGIAARGDDRRGFDHGTFVPMHVSWPDADVPLLQLSMRQGYDVDEHLALGRALAPLRDEGVLIIGSGFSFHNLRLFGEPGRRPSAEFEAWLTDAVVAAPIAERSERLRRWTEAPAARVSHPAEDHLVPLFVAVGAAEGEAGVRMYHDTAFMGSITSSSYRFGLLPAEQPAGAPV